MTASAAFSVSGCLAGSTPSRFFRFRSIAKANSSYSSQVTSCLPIQNGAISTSCCGPSSSDRFASVAGLPIRNVPPGIGTISNFSVGARDRLDVRLHLRRERRRGRLAAAGGVSAAGAEHGQDGEPKSGAGSVARVVFSTGGSGSGSAPRAGSPGVIGDEVCGSSRRSGLSVLALAGCPGAGRSGRRGRRGSSSPKRTWAASSRLFYTPPMSRPPEAPPARRSRGSPHSMRP